MAETLTPKRIHSLDGLRGIAALIVLFHHALLTVPALSLPYLASDIRPVADVWSLEWFLVHTPLHNLWEGNGWVYVFFILSGIVLTLQTLRPAFSWKAYYPHRMIRLYFPIWAAVVASAAAIILIPAGGAHDSLWLQLRASEVSAGAIARDVSLIAGTGNLLSPLWSLRWEILFSLALPLYVWLAAKWARTYVVKIALCFAVVIMAAILSLPALVHMPMFLIGCVMAVQWSRLQAVSARIENTKRPKFIWAFLLSVSLLLLSSHWLVMLFDPIGTVQKCSVALVLLGASILVFVAWHCTTAKVFLGSRLPQWLGKISFSLYLVHEPVVVACGRMLGSEMSLLTLPVSLCFALPIALLFYSVIERPSYVFASRIRLRLTPSRTKVSAASELS